MLKSKIPRKPTLMKKMGRTPSWQFEMPKECEALGSCQRSVANGRLKQIFVNERRSAGGDGRWLEHVRAP